MATQDKSYRFRLPQSLFDAALEKARREDLTLAQVIRRALREWIKDDPPEQEEDNQED